MKITLILFFVLIISCENARWVKGIVVSHSSTSDQYGNITNATIVQTINGAIVQRKSLNFYVKKIGDTVILEQHSWEK